MEKTNMQLGLLPPSVTNLPMSDVKKMKIELQQIKVLLLEIESCKMTESSWDSLMQSIQITNDLVQLIDNANDFYKIGGFDVLPKLLLVSEPKVRALTAELVADLVQNNAFCQSKVLETDIAVQLLKLLKDDQDVNVCIKAMYALSCLARSNHEAAAFLDKLEALPVLLGVIQRPVEKLRTKAAFLLSHLVTHEPHIQGTLYEVGFLQKLAELIKGEPDSSQEFLLRILLTLVEHHNPSKDLCSKLPSLKQALEHKLQLYEGKEEYQETVEYCTQLLNLCFDENGK